MQAPGGAQTALAEIPITRRRFGVLAGVLGAQAAGNNPLGAAPEDFQPQLCLFSKHLPETAYADLAATLVRLGCSAVDLTVRPGGHVLPERVAEDLPRAAAALRERGIAIPMITTGLTSAQDPAAESTLATAARLGIPYYKLGYYRYGKLAALREQLDKTRAAVEGLVALGRRARIQAGFHNHSGTYVGAAVWDAREIVERLDPQWIGYYFDPCHATVEGGLAGWNIAFHLLAGRIRMVAVKDFYWEKVKGKWTARQCPLGEGMVDWKTFFQQLAAIRFRGPISLHLEYEIAGDTAAARRENNLAAIARDFSTLQARVREARQG